MHILGFNKRRTLAIGMALALLVGGLFALLSSVGAQPSTAGINPNNNVCRGYVTAKKVDPAEPESFPVSYRFRCDQAISGYSIFLDGRVLDSVETEAFAYTSAGAPAPGSDLMSCGGELGGYGVNCVGKYSVVLALMSGEFALDKSPCVEPRMQATLTVTTAYIDSKGAAQSAIAGPFGLGKPLRCAPPATQAERDLQLKLRRPINVPRVPVDDVPAD